MAIELGTFGVWKPWQNFADMATGEVADTAAQLEAAGYRALWLGRARADLGLFESILGKTDRLVAATGIANVWTEPLADLVNGYRRVVAEYPDRVLLGVGAGHPEANQQYAKPYEAVLSYTDELIGAGVPAGHVVLAALGPKVLELAGARTAGAHPYLVPPEHTAWARERLGAGPVLAPEQKAVLSDDPAQAREVGRQGIGRYLGLRNYLANLRRLGYTEEDFAGGGSDRLVDALVAWGPVERVADRVRAHVDAGADHVSVQLLSTADAVPLADYTELGAALAG